MLNIWALEKDPTIKALLVRLHQSLDDAYWVLASSQALDSRAVRLRKRDDPLVSAYLYTYGQDEGRCGVHLEYPLADGADISSSLDVHENVGVDALTAMLCVHFEVPGG